MRQVKSPLAVVRSLKQSSKTGVLRHVENSGALDRETEGRNDISQWPTRVRSRLKPEQGASRVVRLRSSRFSADTCSSTCGVYGSAGLQRSVSANICHERWCPSRGLLTESQRICTWPPELICRRLSFVTLAWVRSDFFLVRLRNPGRRKENHL